MNQCNKCGEDNIDKAKYCKICGYELPKKIVEEAPPIEVKPKKMIQAQQLFGMIVGIIMCSLSYYGVQHFFFNKTPGIDKVLMESAGELNKSCPVMVDEETRFDNAIAMPNKTFQYNYTLLNFEKESTDTILIKSALEPGILNSVRTSPEMKYLRDNKITFRYYYKDKNSAYLFRINILPEQYK
ncbi:MAG: zinc ribbon domain-containing protein [Prevotella sp.]|jgi:hypothetical protein|nr:zinc ribbon domain-containing protein [Prevotella sp.]